MPCIAVQRCKQPNQESLFLVFWEIEQNKGTFLLFSLWHTCEMDLGKGEVFTNTDLD